MKCKVEGCERSADYISQAVCQMHYFRFMRNGSYETKEPEGKKAISPNGYMTVYAKGHPVAIMSGRNRVFEHRVIYYDHVNKNPNCCDLCQRSVTWRTLHIDHINSDRLDNRPENLRCLCRGCNIKRGYNENSYGTEIELDGLKMTAAAWARQEGVEVSNSTITKRLRRGMSPRDAIYGEKATHKSKKKKAKARQLHQTQQTS